MPVAGGAGMSKGTAFYATVDMMPPPNVKVRLLVSGYELTAARIRDSRTGWRWVVHDRHGVRDLDRAIARADRPAGGEYWAPVDPASWRLPLPAVGIYVAPSDSAARSRIGASGRLPERQSDAPIKKGQLYRDPLAIAYEPEGSVGRDMTEARVLRAIRFDGVKARQGRLREARAISWPSEWEALSQLIDQMEKASIEAVARRFEPVPADLSDYLTAFGWFTRLNPPELWHKRREAYALNDAQRVLVLRAAEPPFTWAQIGERCSRRTDGQARRFYDKTIDAIHRIANGGQPYDHVTAADQIAQLRERNRAAKLRL